MFPEARHVPTLSMSCVCRAARAVARLMSDVNLWWHDDTPWCSQAQLASAALNCVVRQGWRGT